MYRFMAVLAVSAAVTAVGAAQPNSRRATIVGGGAPDRGKCTIEVVVDGAADVEIRGNQGFLRNLSGQPPQWRRFECTGPVPSNPVDFRFSGVDGRGRQQLVRDPRNGGAAVVRIEDSGGGSEGYTFDITWGGNYTGGGYPNQGYPRPGNPGGRFTAQQAIQVCQSAVRDRAHQEFGGHGIEFLDTHIDDNPGRNDWVIGRIDVLHGPREPEERLGFSCSVDFNSGRVRSVDLQPSGGHYPHGDQGYPSHGSARAFENCERAVRDRLAHDGLDRVDFLNTRVDDNPGRSDWVVGNVRTRRGIFSFSCSVDTRNGNLRSVDVHQR